MNRYFTSFITTALAYSIVGYMFFIYISSNSFVLKSEVKPKVISLKHIELIKQIQEVPKKQVKQEVKKVAETTKEVIKPKPLKKRVVKKVEKKKIVKKLVRKPVKKRPKRKVVKKKVNKAKVSAIKQVVKKPQKAIKANNVRVTKVIPTKKVVKPNIQKVYLAKNLLLIRKQIQKYIKYPKRAKKFGIQDIVKVRFKLLKNGDIVDIVLLKGHKLFNKATIRAIQKASFKFPKVQKDITIELPIEYKLI